MRWSEAQALSGTGEAWERIVQILMKSLWKFDYSRHSAPERY
jgi:hypothetical protein